MTLVEDGSFAEYVRVLLDERDALSDTLLRAMGDGVPLPSDGWRDDWGHEWNVWLGEMVECPRCAFMFSSDHHDQDAESYTCPNCKQGEIEEAIRDRLAGVIVSHGVGEMSEQLAQLLAVVTGGDSVGR
jgi:hypothetical protein